MKLNYRTVQEMILYQDAVHTKSITHYLSFTLKYKYGNVAVGILNNGMCGQSQFYRTPIISASKRSSHTRCINLIMHLFTLLS